MGFYCILLEFASNWRGSQKIMRVKFRCGSLRPGIRKKLKDGSDFATSENNKDDKSHARGARRRR